MQYKSRMYQGVPYTIQTRDDLFLFRSCDPFRTNQQIYLRPVESRVYGFIRTGISSSLSLLRRSNLHTKCKHGANFDFVGAQIYQDMFARE